MKLKPIARIAPHQKTFFLKGELFEVTTPVEKKVWTLKKRFGGQVQYRVLSSVVDGVPVAIQRQKAS